MEPDVDSGKEDNQVGMCCVPSSRGEFTERWHPRHVRRAGWEAWSLSSLLSALYFASSQRCWEHFVSCYSKSFDKDREGCRP